ncbi:peptidase C39 family protein [Massilia sp. WF1]|uniref:C39 family peptidase n=1 Tax=unclassified Massilia TaxID=2609279 RepID=UPI0006493720|nr:MULTISPECIES: C39 family peptidase [unclassified Massilia]ALK96027.1 peptidase C39 family protein [Massilia sp. WG5]KLU37391.1 peptidase C39 family protein [Massilia sp. WF1]
MIAVLLGILAAMLGGAGVLAKHEAQDRPLDRFDIPTTMSVAATGVQNVTIEPFSELKYKNIVHQAYDYSCGSAALVTILKYHLGLDVTEQQSMEGMMAFGEKEKIIERRGFSLLDMKRYLASLNVQSAGFRAEMADLQTLDQPGIVPIDYAGFKHFVVLRGVRGGLVFLADPAMGNIIFSVEEFATLWDRNTLFIAYPPKDRPPVAKLALSDNELGVTDMDRVRNRGLLRPIDNQLQMERLLNGFGGVSIRKQ